MQQDVPALPSSTRKRPHSFSVISDPEFEDVNNPPKRHMAEMMAHGVQRMISLTADSDDPSTSEGPNHSTARTPTPPAHGTRAPSLSSHGALFSRSSGGGRGEDHDLDPAHSMCMSDSLNGAPSLDASIDDENVPRRVSSSAVMSPSLVGGAGTGSGLGAAGGLQHGVGRTPPPPTFAQSPPVAATHPLPPLPHSAGTSQGQHDVSMSEDNNTPGSATRGAAGPGALPSVSSQPALPPCPPQPAQAAPPATRPLASRRLSDSVFRTLSAGLIVPPTCGMGSVVPKDPGAPGTSAGTGGGGPQQQQQAARNRQAPSPRVGQLSSSQLQIQDLLPPSPSDARFTFADLRKMALLRSTMQREEATNATGMQVSTDGPCSVEVALMGSHAAGLATNTRAIDTFPKSPLGAANPATTAAAGAAGWPADRLAPAHTNLTAPHPHPHPHTSTNTHTHPLGAAFPLPPLHVDAKHMSQPAGMAAMGSATHTHTDPFAPSPMSPPMPPHHHTAAQQHSPHMALGSPFLSPSRGVGVGGGMYPFRGRATSPRAESWMEGTTQSGMVDDSSSGSGSDADEVEQRQRRHQAVVLGPGGIAHVPHTHQFFS